MFSCVACAAVSLAASSISSSCNLYKTTIGVSIPTLNISSISSLSFTFIALTSTFPKFNMYPGIFSISCLLSFCSGYTKNIITGFSEFSMKLVTVFSCRNMSDGTCFDSASATLCISGTKLSSIVSNTLITPLSNSSYVYVSFSLFFKNMSNNDFIGSFSALISSWLNDSIFFCMLLLDFVILPTTSSCADVIFWTKPLSSFIISSSISSMSAVSSASAIFVYLLGLIFYL